MTAEEKIARVKDFRLIDDVFFEVFAEDKDACQEIAKVKDGSKVSELMDCFTQQELVDHVNFPATSRRVRELKTTEGVADALKRTTVSPEEFQTRYTAWKAHQ